MTRLPNRNSTSQVPPWKTESAFKVSHHPSSPGDSWRKKLGSPAWLFLLLPTELCWMLPKLPVLARGQVGWPWASWWDGKAGVCPHGSRGPLRPFWAGTGHEGDVQGKLKEQKVGQFPLPLPRGKPVSSTICWDLEGSGQPPPGTGGISSHLSQLFLHWRCHSIYREARNSLSRT